MKKYYGFIVNDECLVCPECAKNPDYQLEGTGREGYPDGYTCVDCGKVVM